MSSYTERMQTSPPPSQFPGSGLISTVFRIIAGTINLALYFFRYAEKQYSGDHITVTKSVEGETKGQTFVCTRTGRRDKYVLVDTSLDFLIFHRHRFGIHFREEGYIGGLPQDFKVYRVRKGWLDGFFGWGWSGFGQRKGWEEVTPDAVLTAKKSKSSVVYEDHEWNYATEPSKAAVNHIKVFSPDAIGSPDDLNAVSHVGIHLPLTTTDGFYRFVITDVSGKGILAVTPDYTLHSSFTSFGILKGSTIQALPIQFVGFFIKNIIAAFVSGLLTAFYWSGIASIGGFGGIAIRVFMWYFKDEVADVRQRAARFVAERGIVKPLDYLARAAGGGLPGSSERFVEYERMWERSRKDHLRAGKGYVSGGSWVVMNMDRSMFGSKISK